MKRPAASLYTQWAAVRNWLDPTTTPVHQRRLAPTFPMDDHGYVLASTISRCGTSVLAEAKLRSAAIVRMVNAIARTIPTVKTVNTNLAGFGFGFGAMYPSWRQTDVSMPDFRGAKRKRCVDYFTLQGVFFDLRYSFFLFDQSV